MTVAIEPLRRPSDAPEGAPAVGLPAATLEAVTEEQQLTDRAEQALAALLQALLHDAAPPDTMTASLRGSVSPATLRSVAEPLLIPLLLSVGIIMMRRSRRRGDSSSWHAVIDKVLDGAIDKIAAAVEAEERRYAALDFYSKTKLGIQERSHWIAATIVTGVVESFKEKLATRMGFTYKRWQSREDSRVRDSHRRLNGVVVPRDQKFVTENGASLSRPGDQSAPMSEWINCRCRVLWLRGSDV